MADEQHDSAPGWDAINAAVDRLYPDAKPVHWGTAIRFLFGGPDPLDGISAYDAGDHWHYVSYGMSELYDKQSDNADDSGWGFEFTFRLAKQDDTPPVWAANLLQNLARYVHSSGNHFDVGHRMPLNGPIALGQETAIHAVLFAADPELPPMDSPHGRVVFLQVVGITSDERLAAGAWDTKKFAAAMQDGNPKLVTDLARSTRLDDPAFSARWEAGRKADGSSSGNDFMTQLSWSLSHDGPELRIGAVGVTALVQTLPGRVPFNRRYRMVSSEHQVVFVRGDGALRASVEDNQLRLVISDVLAQQIGSGLRPVRGTYPFDGLTIVVEPTDIQDNDGNVVDTIG